MLHVAEFRHLFSGKGIRSFIIGRQVLVNDWPTYGIITSSQFTEEPSEPNKEALLRHYLKNKRNRENYWEEICDFIEEDLAAKTVQFVYFYRIRK